jgi:hypothetical protein
MASGAVATGELVSGLDAIPFVSDDAASAVLPPDVSAAGGSCRQPWISSPRNKTTFAATMAHTIVLNCSRRFCCRSAFNDPGPLNGFNVFTVFSV